mmetsp:Transcript_15605/g.28376  ORF Transcript_15605/g.28376 Transcript_15605/m.28376 type:complete len:132 (-) Transcript_15605:325-720(-)
MSLIRALRPRLAQMQRRRLASSIEDDFEKPHHYYVVKDYEKNPFYGADYYALRPGAKKSYDPFLKAFERTDAFWRPVYYGQHSDLVPTTMIVMIFMLPIITAGLFYFESRYRSYKDNPLGYNMAVPREFNS